MEEEERATSPERPLVQLSFNGAIYPGGRKTGVFFVEALHPYGMLTAAGFEVVWLASETGTWGFDDVSLTPPFLSGSEHAILNNPKVYKGAPMACAPRSKTGSTRICWRSSKSELTSSIRDNHDRKKSLSKGSARHTKVAGITSRVSVIRVGLQKAKSFLIIT